MPFGAMVVVSRASIALDNGPSVTRQASLNSTEVHTGGLAGGIALVDRHGT